MADDGWETLDDAVLEAYLADVVHRRDAADSPREVTVVHTALHGSAPRRCAARSWRPGTPPHPGVLAGRAGRAFPTVAFPNPEETGAIDSRTRSPSDIDPTW